MENLCSVLQKMHDSLGELEKTLVEELNQLKGLQVNPVSLQIVSDCKRQLLSTIGYYDDLRKKLEENVEFSASYLQNPRYATLWSNITLKAQKARDMNMKVYELLDLHMQKTNSLKKALTKPGTTTTLYGSEGETRSSSPGRVYNISV